MDFTRLTGSPDLDPVANVHPYSYRDARTHLEDIKALRNWAENEFSRLNSLVTGNDFQLETEIVNTNKKFDDIISRLELRLIELIKDTHNEGTAFDPTTGATHYGVSTVIAHVYDNARVYALFADELDKLGMTALDWDKWMEKNSTRHFDLGCGYPNLHDVRKS